MNRRILPLLYTTLIAACVISPSAIGRLDARSSGGTSSTTDAESIAAFESIIPVLHHPRCINCHSTGDYPRQGDDSHRHTMQVRRGPEGDGVKPLQCNTCHQDHNLAEVHAPPGAPD